MKYVSSRKASEILGIHQNTLRKYADEGKIPHIRSEKGHRRYDVETYLKQYKDTDTICYCRVSSRKQSDDLARQVAFMQSIYPKATIITDIASGINFKRKGLQTILERILKGDKLKVVVAHKDRIARFGFDLIKFLVEQNGGEILVLNEDVQSVQEELAKDILSILHVFSCRLHGIRKYYNKIKEDLPITDQTTEEDDSEVDGNYEVVL